MIHRSVLSFVAVIAAGLVGLAGCGSAPAPAAPPAVEAAPEGGHGGHGGGAADGQLELWAVQTSLGVVVTDGTGDLIYRSDRDGSAPSTSNCTGDCLATWQPVAADLNNPPVLLGVNQDVVGVVSRADGTNQLTIAGWPIYRHIGTHTDEETQANGTDGVWFAIGPDGGKAAPPAG